MTTGGVARRGLAVGYSRYVFSTRPTILPCFRDAVFEGEIASIARLVGVANKKNVQGRRLIAEAITVEISPSGLNGRYVSLRRRREVRNMAGTAQAVITRRIFAVT